MRSHLTFFTWGGGGCAGEMVDEPELDPAVGRCGGGDVAAGVDRSISSGAGTKTTGAFYLDGSQLPSQRL